VEVAGRDGGGLEIAAYLGRAIRAGDAETAHAAALLLQRDGWTTPRVYDDLVCPVLAAVGQDWAEHRIGIAEEHRASAGARQLTALLRGSSARPARSRGRVLLLPAPAEAHVLGLEMARHVLEEGGWTGTVIDSLPVGELARLATAYADVRAVGMTASVTARPDRAARALADWRALETGIPMLLGGGAATRPAGTVPALLADAFVPRLDALLETLDTVTSPLTAREREVLQLAGEGLTNEEIARRLDLQPSTVKSHLERAYAKAGARDRAASVARALREGWIT